MASSDGRRQGKSNFAQTCNLLSRYVKEKGGLTDFNFQIDGQIQNFQAILKPGSNTAASTRNLLTNIENSPPPSMDSFPHKQDCFINKATKSNDSTEVEKKTAPLTIFYAGKVLVFDDYPVDKAKKLVSFAQFENSRMRRRILSNTLQEKLNQSEAPQPQANSSLKSVGISSKACKETPIPSISGAMASSSRLEKRLPDANGSDMPIARRSSLHRFLEKRKDRSAARGPYQIQELPASSSKDDEQLELKL